jgi:hypothetical protein
MYADGIGEERIRNIGLVSLLLTITLPLSFIPLAPKPLTLTDAIRGIEIVRNNARIIRRHSCYLSGATAVATPTRARPL